MIRIMLSEAMWGRLAPLLPPQKPWTGRPSLDHRRFLEAVLWLARTGAPWRDLPPELMNWRGAWRRLQRWSAAGIWGRIVDALRALAPDAGWDAHMLDSSVIRAHPMRPGRDEERAGRRSAAPVAGSPQSCTCAATAMAGQ
jgi:transposase